jgi:site-specific DNA recombinase
MAVALYARVSTTRQAENDLSIPDQLRQMQEWCKANGFTIALEYIEPGASAKDDKRPVFQQMIADATLVPAPYEAIIVHSLSRFFRDSLEFALYERQLKRAGVKLISISQLTAENASGDMARKMFSLFDEYQSKENSKHTLRAMKENARQGFFNGSRPPFGYKVIETETIGNRGRKKKKLAIEPSEAETVRTIYRLYVDGHHGCSVGMKSIASLLNQQGYRMRGNPWRAQKVNEVLADTTYIGEYYFNKKYAHNMKPKPREEWVLTNVEPIIDKELYQQTSIKREAHSPDKTNPKHISSPIFLSGLLKCGQCGAGMTLMTGKSGQYRYYKCTNQKHKSKHLCNTPNIPMEKLDNDVRERLADRVFTPGRVRNMLTKLKKHINAQDQGEKAHVGELQQILKKTDAGLERLYEGVEHGTLELDSTLQARVQKLKAKREETLIQISGIKRRQMLPINTITNPQVDAFCTALKQRFRDPESGFGKGYLKFLVDEIRIEDKHAVLKGSHRALAEVISTLNPENPATSVPTTIREWRAREDSNLWPLPSEGSTLSN